MILFVILMICLTIVFAIDTVQKRRRHRFEKK